MHAGFDRSAAVILATLTRAAFTRAAAIRLDGMTEDLSPAAHAQAIAAARQRLLTFVQLCTDGDWRAASVDGDTRPIGVIADHVADAYEYLAGWIARWPLPPSGRASQLEAPTCHRPTR